MDAAPAPQSPFGPEPSRARLSDDFAQLVQTMLQRGLNLHNPRYVGHQVPAPVPLAGLFDAVGSVTNQVMAVYEMGPWATAVEQAMIRELGATIGWAPDTFAGAVTHGGSLANLTALLTARNVALGDVWERGLTGDRPQPVLVTHADAHYSVARAAGILGLGSRQIRHAGLDDLGRMDPRRLDEQLTSLRAQGRPIVAVSACSCATPTGAFDPLEEIAAVCREHGVWLHVDAAHGGAALLSERHRHLVAGLEQADSVTWDAHKMLFVPGLCAFVFYRDKRHGFEAFRQDAPYLFDPAAPGLADYDSGIRTVECSKRAATFGLWGVWSLFGRRLFTDMVDVTFGLGRTFYDKLAAAGTSSRCTRRSATSWCSATSRTSCVTPRANASAHSSWSSAPRHRVGGVLHRADRARRRRRSARHDHQPAHNGRSPRPAPRRHPTPQPRAVAGLRATCGEARRPGRSLSRALGAALSGPGPSSAGSPWAWLNLHPQTRGLGWLRRHGGHCCRGQPLGGS